jgi:hydrogenase expression/formation protein HypD
MKVLLFSKEFEGIGLDELVGKYGVEPVVAFADGVESTKEFYFERLAEMAKGERYILTLYPDMLQMKGYDFEKMKKEGSDIRVVNNLEEAMLVAKSKRRHSVVFPTFGFESFVAATAAALIKALMAGIRNFKILNDLKSETALLSYLLRKQTDIEGVVLTPEFANLMGRDRLMDLSSQYKVYFTTSEYENLMDKVERLIQNMQAKNQRQLLHSNIPMKSNAMIESVISEVFELVDGYWETYGIIPKSKYKLRDNYLTHKAE